MTEDALEIATDPDYRFELAIQLGKLEIAKVLTADLCEQEYSLSLYLFLPFQNIMFLYQSALLFISSGNCHCGTE